VCKKLTTALLQSGVVEIRSFVYHFHCFSPKRHFASW